MRKRINTKQLNLRATFQLNSMKASNWDASRKGVIAAGNWLIDHVKIIDAWPPQDALANILSQSNGNGGGPYNVSKNLARMKCGFPLAGIGLLGHDADAEQILADCDAHGINHDGLQHTDAAPTSYTDVMTVRGSGRRTFFHQQGANALLGPEHFDLSKSRARIFYLGYLCLLRKLDEVGDDGTTGASKLLQQARELGFMTVGDLVSSEVGDFPKIINPSLPHLDVLLLNEYELARLTASAPEPKPSVAELERQAKAVLSRGVRMAVVAHCIEGAVCVQPDAPTIFQPSVRVPANLIRGAAGAGDAFGAGYILGLHEGWETKRCLELGVCVAAASLRDATCSTSVEPVESCLELGRQHGYGEFSC